MSLRNRMWLEGVEHHRFLVTFRLSDGRRRRWVRWAPARIYLLESVSRELFDRFGSSGVRDRSCRAEAT